MKKLFIYDDDGTSVNYVNSLKTWLTDILDNRYKISFVNAEDISEKEVLREEGATALFMPGGQSRFFKKKLEGKGDLEIQQFVSRGNLYYGFCAGGYYAAKEVDFKGATLNIHKEHKKAVFFNGVARGSIPELANNELFNHSFISSNIVNVRYGDGKIAGIYYHGGSSFSRDFNDASSKVLATYLSLPEGENIAAVECKFGDGHAVLSGVHPEINAQEVDKTIYPGMANFEKARSIRDTLKNCETGRRSFSKHILQRLM